VQGLKIVDGRIEGLTVRAAGGMAAPGRPVDPAAERAREAVFPAAEGAGGAAGGRRGASKEILAERVILAAGPEEARQLAALDMPALEPLGVSVVYFSIPHRVSAERRIFLDGGGGGLAHHCIFLSNICPEYAPSDRQLLSATVLGMPDSEGEAMAERVRRQMSVWFPRGRSEDWRWLATYKIPVAQFRQPPGLLGRLPGAVTPVRGLYLAGDYTRHSSLQGALESGQIAARTILED